MGERVLDWLMDHVAPWFLSALIVLVVLLLIAAPFYLYAESQQPTFELKKRDWRCTAAHTETSTAFVQSGSVMVPVTSSSTVCDAYSRQ